MAQYEKDRLRLRAIVRNRILPEVLIFMMITGVFLLENLESIVMYTSFGHLEKGASKEQETLLIKWPKLKKSIYLAHSR